MTNAKTSSAAAPRLRIAVPVLWLALSACGGPDESPEARIRSLVSEAESAAEARDVSALRDKVSGEYQDERGYDRRTVLRLIQGTLLRNQNVHLLSVVRDVRVNGATATAVVLVAAGSQPIESTEALVNVRADLMRFDVELVLEGDQWRARAVDWRRAELNDFL